MTKDICPICFGNDGDTPCAYPKTRDVRCLRRQRLNSGAPDPVAEAIARGVVDSTENMPDADLFLLVKAIRHVMTSDHEARDYLKAELDRRVAEANKRALEKVVQFCFDDGYSTGHADTVDDVLTELALNIKSSVAEAEERQRERCLIAVRNYLFVIGFTHIIGDIRDVILNAGGKGDEEGPDEEDGPWADGWDERSKGGADITNGESNTKFIPCPWCFTTNDISSGESAILRPDGIYVVSTCCLNCGATGPGVQVTETSYESDKKADEAWNTRADTCIPKDEHDLNKIAARIVAMCKKRGWSMHWTHRGAYLHLESSELIEAIRGKHGDPADEAGDVLLVLMSITEYAGIPFSTVIDNALRKLSYLENSPPYPGEERATKEPEGCQELCKEHRRFPCKECGTKHFDGCRCVFCKSEIGGDDGKRIR